MPFKPSEICELTIDGIGTFRDWKTVLVWKGILAAYNYYRFTVSEDAPAPPAQWSQIRIAPGAHCTVKLGGYTAIRGFVVTRQVGYAAQHHVVEILGKTYTWPITRAAASGPGMEYTKIKFQELATKLLAPFNITYVHKGGTNDQEEFPRVNLLNQTVWEVLENYSRAAGVVLGPVPTGNDPAVLVGAPPDYSEGIDVVKEGLNILEGREILSIELGPGPGTGSIQRESKPSEYGAKAISKPWVSQPLDGMFKAFGRDGMFMPLRGMLEVQGTDGHLKGRQAIEQMVRDIEQARVEIVVQGWLKPSGGLWHPWMKVFVDSPMLIMNEALTCRSVTFTQDDRSGTRTTLELWRHMKEAAGPDTGGGGGGG